MDLILYGGTIHTMNVEQPLAQAVWVHDGRFVAVGSDGEVCAQAGAGAKRWNLDGACVYPGLMDSHLHILNHAITARELVLSSMRTRQQVLDAVANRACSLPEGAWLDGRGFNEDLWDDPRQITRQELDAIAPNHAVRLTRVCGHLVVANSRAMEAAGVTAQTRVPEGGEINFEKGFFAENAIDLLFHETRDLGVKDCKQLLYEGMCDAADAGLTAIFSDDFGTGGFGMQTVSNAYRELEQEGRMPVRVVQQCALPTDEAWKAFLQSGLAYGQGSDFYRIGPRKLYADGSLGARTAWLTAPYADAPERNGVSIYAQEELNRLAAQTHEAGMPFIVHAIGDAAVNSVLDAVEYARMAVPGTEKLPSGMVHCQITSAEQLRRIAQMRVSVYAQPVFVEYDMHICRDRVGDAMMQTSYNWKTLLDAGVNLSAGSDCPVEPLDPAKNIYCAVTRKDFNGAPEGGWLSEQRLSVNEAVRSHTVEAARAVGYEDKLGQIRPGFLADVSVFPKDFEAIAPEAILFEKPLFTMVNGVVRRCSRRNE